MKLFRAAILSTTLLVSPLAAAAGELKVVATFSIIGDFARQVGGDRIDLSVLVGAGGDAHVYEARPKDAALLGAADVILANGANFEGFIGRLVSTSGTKAPVVELTKGISLIGGDDDDGHDEHAHDKAEHDHDNHDHKGHDHKGDYHKGDDHAGHDHGTFDPHAFQSAANAATYVGNIADAFCAADAAGCDTYRSNAARYAAELRALDAELKAQVARVPEDRRTIITSHDAFRYFDQAYGIRFLSPKGVSTEAEASAADVARLIDQVRDAKAAAVFVENVTNPRLVEQIARETGLKVGGALYSDALSAADGPAATYVELMRHNMRTIVGAVTGS